MMLREDFCEMWAFILSSGLEIQDLECLVDAWKGFFKKKEYILKNIFFKNEEISCVFRMCTDHSIDTKYYNHDFTHFTWIS